MSKHVLNSRLFTTRNSQRRLTASIVAAATNASTAVGTLQELRHNPFATSVIPDESTTQL